MRFGKVDSLHRISYSLATQHMKQKESAMNRLKAFFGGAAVLVVLCAAAAAGAAESMDYKAILAKTRAGVLATEDGTQPRTRVFGLLRVDGDRYWFCTGASKDVYKQMQTNNRISFCAWDTESNIVLNLDGPVTFVEDPALKAEFLDENPGIKSIYKSADNPEFKIFYLEPDTISSFDFVNGKVYHKK